jgi:PAS domain S-box-containing protein
MQLPSAESVEQNFEMAQYALDNAQDAIFRVNEDARIIYANNAACQQLGYSRDELLALTIPDIDPAFFQEAWFPYWEELRKIGWKRFESCHKRKDGTVFPVEITTKHMGFGGKDFCLASARDITQRQEIERKLKINQFSLENTGDSLFRTNQDARIIYANNSACQHLGYSKDELLALSIPDIDPDFSMDTWKQFFGGG